MNYIFIICLTIFLNGCTYKVELPNIGASLQDTEAIYSKTYNTYSTFFFSRSIDITNDEKKRIEALKKSFVLFSDSIGEKNIGIWVGSTLDKFSTKESKKLCDKYNLSYNDGPYLIISKNNPLINNVNINDIIIDFSGINYNRIKYILNEIEQDIRRNEYPLSGKYHEYRHFIFSKYENNEEFINEILIHILNFLGKNK